MSDLVEHGECAESLAAYALGALPEEAARRVERHLSRCPICRAELESLHAAVDAMATGVPAIDPPPELRSRLMEVVDAEAEAGRAGGADRSARSSPRSAWRWWSPAPRLVLAASALGALIVATVILAASGGGMRARTIGAQVTGPVRAAGGRASLRVRGTSAVLVVRNFPPPASGSVDELWVVRGASPPAPAGTFAARSGSIRVLRPVRPGDRVLVTAEPAPGTSAPTGTPFVAVRA